MDEQTKNTVAAVEEQITCRKCGETARDAFAPAQLKHRWPRCRACTSAANAKWRASPQGKETLALIRASEKPRAADVESKRCSMCGETKLAADFYVSTRDNRLTSKCRDCHAKYNAQPESRRKRAIYDVSPQGRFTRARRRAKAAEVPFLFQSAEDYCAKFFEYDTCRYCGVQVKTDAEHHGFCATTRCLDRIDSSGPYSADNTQVLCGQCNKVKSDSDSDPAHLLLVALCVAEQAAALGRSVDGDRARILSVLDKLGQ